jgi:phosphoesterase RecJ-like protein
VVHEIPARTFSALVVVDTASEKRVGPGVGELRTRAERTYNLDHHVSNVGWGERNYIDADAPASALIVWELCRELGVAVVPQIANLLYAGLLDDTGGFCFSNTNARSFRCAAALVDGGADPEKVANALYFNQPLRLLKLHALALQTLSLELGGRVSLISITARGLERCGAKAEDVEGIVDLARRVEGTQVAIFQRELDDGWKFSLRSKDPRIDVNEVAATFGGGGHTAAAGCKITGSEEEARDRVLRRVAEVLL